MEELNKKIAEWLGEHWIEGRGKYLNTQYTDSFDTCLEYILPKLEKGGFRFHLWHVRRGWCVNLTWLEDIGYKRRQRVTNGKYESVAETAALAFCLAVEKLIDGENK